MQAFEVSRVQVTTANGSTVWLTIIRLAIGTLGGTICYYIAKELFDQLGMPGLWHPRRVSSLPGVRTSSPDETTALRAGKKISASSPAVTLMPTSAAKAWLHDCKQAMVADQLNDGSTSTGTANTITVGNPIISPGRLQSSLPTGLVGAGSIAPSLQTDWQLASRLGLDAHHAPAPLCHRALHAIEPRVLACQLQDFNCCSSFLCCTIASSYQGACSIRLPLRWQAAQQSLLPRHVAAKQPAALACQCTLPWQVWYQSV